MSFTTTNNLLKNRREIQNYNEIDCRLSNPSINNANDVNEKHCDENYETKSRTDDMDNDDNDDDSSTCEFAKPRTPWYGSAVVHWLVFDVIG